ncbi:hypothetical protein T08_11302 [Trichinella sp. T8]|nr:hypothetical protein T08_11302 [Trichinella sp. T8]
MALNRAKIAFWSMQTAIAGSETIQFDSSASILVA